MKSTLLAILLMGTSAFAQTNEPVVSVELIATYDNINAEEVAKEQTDKMNGYLNLSEEQYTQAYELNLLVARKIHSVQNNINISADRKPVFIEGNLLDRRNAMSGILSEEQFKLFDEAEYQ